MEENKNTNSNNKKEKNVVKKHAKKIGVKIALHALPYVLIFLIIVMIIENVLQVATTISEAISSSWNSIVQAFQSGDENSINQEIDKFIAEIEKQEGDDVWKRMKIISDNYSEGGPNSQMTKEEREKIQKRKYVRKFLEAQYKTQEINPKTVNSAQSNIVVKRVADGANDSSSSNTIKYVSMSELNSLLTKAIEQSNSTEEIKDEDRINIKEYYSINASGQLVVPIKTETGTDGEPNIVFTLQQLDYKSYIAQYATPAQFYIYLGEIIGNPDFLEDFVNNVVKNTKIELTILTNTIDTRVKTTYTYTLMELKGTQYQEAANQPTKVITNSYKIEESAVIRVTAADTWQFKQNTVFTNATNGPNTTRYATGENGVPAIEDQNPKGSSYKVKQKLVKDTTVTTQRYDNGSTSSYEYRAGEIPDQNKNYESFVDMLYKDYPVPYAALWEKEKPITAFKKYSELFFELLNRDPTTQNSETFMRYVYKKATEANYQGQFDFSMFDVSYFTTISGVYGSTVEDKVWYALKSLGYSNEAIAGAMGNIAYESSGFDCTALNSSSGAYGLAQWKDERRQRLQNYATSKGTTEADVDTQIEYLIAELTGKGAAAGYAVQRTAGGRGENYRTYKQWKEAKSVSLAAVAYCWFFETPSGASIKTPEIEESERKRIELAEEYYELYKNRGVGGTFEGSSVSSVKCYYIASNGRKYTILHQGNIRNPMDDNRDWTGKCNRAAAAIIASGYTYQTYSELINTMNTTGVSGQHFRAVPPDRYWNQYGLTISKLEDNWPGANKEYMEGLASQLVSGGYAMFWLNNNKTIYKGKSGTTWTELYHWVAAIDYKYIDEKMQIAIADWRGITWVDIDEFTTHGITRMVYINEMENTP